ncbi:MAG: hypothetical protein U0166_28675 [Acidobacteriota bacterium]
MAADLDYSGVRGAHTLRAGFASASSTRRVTRGSLMPDLSLSEAEADELTLYMLSLRALDVPEAFWPRTRSAARLGEREFATDESLFGVFCAGCRREAPDAATGTRASSSRRSATPTSSPLPPTPT